MISSLTKLSVFVVATPSSNDFIDIKLESVSSLNYGYNVKLAKVVVNENRKKRFIVTIDTKNNIYVYSIFGLHLICTKKFCGKNVGQKSCFEGNIMDDGVVLLENEATSLVYNVFDTTDADNILFGYLFFQ